MLFSRILLDTGEGKDDYIPVLSSAMKKYNIESIDAIVCSHFHHDHVGGIPSIIDAKLLVKHEEKEKETDKEKDKQDKEDKEYKILKYKCETTDGEMKLDKSYINKFGHLNDNDLVVTEGATLEVIYTPGHCDDHIAFYMKEENAIFSGDCILGGSSAVFSDLHTYMKSLNKLQLLKADCIYPGHGPKIENAHNMIIQYINHRNKRENQILNVLNENENEKDKDKERNKDKDKNKDSDNCLTSMRIVELVYTDTPKDYYKYARMNVVNHLTKLIKDNKVEMIQDDQYRLKSN